MSPGDPCWQELIGRRLVSFNMDPTRPLTALALLDDGTELTITNVVDGASRFDELKDYIKSQEVALERSRADLARMEAMCSGKARGEGK